MIRPFDGSGIVRGSDSIARYQGRPNSLLEMLRATVDRAPTNDAIVELGGERVNYRELWDRAARSRRRAEAAGSPAGRPRGDPAGQRPGLVRGVFGNPLAGAIVVPVNTRFSEPEIEYVITDSGSAIRLSRRTSRCRRAEPRGGRSRAARTLGDLLHQRHHRISQRRHDHARGFSCRTSKRAGASFRFPWTTACGRWSRCRCFT